MKLKNQHLVSADHRCIRCKKGPKQVNFHVMAYKDGRGKVVRSICNRCRYETYTGRTERVYEKKKPVQSVQQRIKEYFDENYS